MQTFTSSEKNLMITSTHVAKAITIQSDNYMKRYVSTLGTKRYTITQKLQDSFEYFAVKKITLELGSVIGKLTPLLP